MLEYCQCSKVNDALLVAIRLLIVLVFLFLLFRDSDQLRFHPFSFAWAVSFQSFERMRTGLLFGNGHQKRFSRGVNIFNNTII